MTAKAQRSTAMTEDNTQKDWTELKGKIKSKWIKFVDADVEAFKGNLHLITEKVQKVYGITKDKAEQEYADFKKTLEAKPNETTKPKPN